MNTLVPLFAIGVFVGFTIAGIGMVRHWWLARGPGWRWRMAINGLGAVFAGAATVITTAAKFTAGAWVVALALPLLVLAFLRINRAYQQIGQRLGVGCVPPPPHGSRSLVIVPVRRHTEAIVCRLRFHLTAVTGPAGPAALAASAGDERAAPRPSRPLPGGGAAVDGQGGATKAEVFSPRPVDVGGCRSSYKRTEGGRDGRRRRNGARVDLARCRCPDGPARSRRNTATRPPR
jgi:hypothetical protein